MRIVSLLPSATEIVYALGLGEQLVARSHECDYPPEAESVPVITYSLIPPDLPSHEIDRMVSETLMTHATLYGLNLDLLRALEPDLLITQALCDVCAVSFNSVQAAVATLSPRTRVLSLEPTTLQGVMETFQMVADAAGVPERGRRLIAEFQARMERVCQHTRPHPPVRVTFLEWIDPPFACGHWTPELVQLAGGIDGHGKAGQPSRRLEWQEVLDWQPEAIVIACCGFTVERTLRDVPILEQLPGWDSLPAVRQGKVFIADGNAYFSRPSPRLADSLEWLAEQLAPCNEAAGLSV
ncbi:MAG: cobalamin-binding protein [Armatimonadetes bacterium JP3_11]|jgi:iron complex transport system substrate-binding protein|nr:MAG: cobalamin-binding protein [Armatimonadetes bacterium CP1_7O]OYT75357.1 MAG: cobalamin-binding protein [Armatimonadetes bacterium JP3_11]RMH06201.1 MAG: cobalamin-binding protein [Armatimonadota bacterium]